MPTIITNGCGKPLTLPLQPACLLPPGKRVVYVDFEPEDIIAALGGGALVAALGLDIQPTDWDHVSDNEGLCPVLYANSEDLDTLSGQVGTLSSKAALLEYFFHTTSELLYTAAQAGLALPYPSPIQQLHLDTLKILVRGASAWDGNLSKLTIQDTSSSPVPLVDIDVAALLGNAILLPGSAGVTLHPAFVMGATPGKSLHIIADDTVTAGSPLEIMIAGRNWQPV